MRFPRLLAAAGCVVVLSVASRAQSNWPTDTANRLPVAVTGAAENLTGVASDGYYGVLAVWQSDDGHVYAEKIDPIGALNWSGMQVSLFDAAGLTQTDAAVTDDSLRGGYVAWVDDRDGGSVMYLQHIGEIGNRVGVFQNLDVVVSEDVSKLRGTIAFDGTTADVVGTNTLLQTEVAAGDYVRIESEGTWYRVDASGPSDELNLTLTSVPPAAASGVASVVKYDPATFSDCRAPKTLSNSVGCYVAFQNYTEALPADVAGANRLVPLIQLAYVSAEGQKLWTTDIDFMHPDTEITLYSDDEDGVILVWHLPPFVDPNRALKAASVTRGVRIDPNGEGVWGEDPVDLSNGSTAATCHDSYDGSLWVATRWWFDDEGKVTEADNGDFVVVNKLLPTGSWAWGTWPKAFEWDSKEKSEFNTLFLITLHNLSQPYYDDFHTDQRPVGITGDGMGGAHVLIKDSRRTDLTAPTTTLLSGDLTFTNGSTAVTGDLAADFDGLDDLIGTPDDEVRAGDRIKLDSETLWQQVASVDAQDQLTLVSNYPGATDTGPASVISGTGGANYHEPYQNLFAHHVSPDGKISWRWGDETIRWNEDASGHYVKVAADGTETWYEYPWIEGAMVYAAGGATTKDHGRAVCRPWTSYNPVTGHTLASTLTTIWTEDYDADYPVAESRDYDSIKLVQLSILGDRLDWDRFPATVTPVLDVITDLGGLTTDQYAFEAVSDERYGVTIVWEEDGEIYAKHVNYHQMVVDAQRADPIGLGPDIFPPPPVISFVAQDHIGEVELIWTNPAAGVKPLTDFAGVMIRRATAGPPATVNQGKFVYEGTLEQWIDTDVQAGVLYYYSAFTFDTEVGDRNFSGPVSASALVGLGDVDNFLAQGTDGAVLLSWDEPGGADYEGVVIRRSQTDYPADINDGSPVGDFPVGTTTHTDSPLTNGVICYYTAFAHKALIADHAEGVTAFAVPIVGVTNLVALGTDKQINLSWNMPTTATTTFVDAIVRRSDTDYPATVTEGVEVAIVPASTSDSHSTSDDTDGVEPIQLYVDYYYSVFAHYSFGAPINRDVYAAPAQASAMAGDFTPPDPITDLQATSGEDAQVTLTWTNPAYGTVSDWVRVVVRRSDEESSITGSTDGVLVFEYSRPDNEDDHVSAGTVADTNVSNGTTYYYAIIVVDEQGNESTPYEVSATPIDNTAPDMPSLIVVAVILVGGDLQDQEPALYIEWSIDTGAAPNEDLNSASPVIVLRAHWDAESLPADEADRYPSSINDVLLDNVVGIGTLDTSTGTQKSGAALDMDILVGVTYYYAAWAIDDENPPNVSPRATASATPVDNFPPEIENVSVTVSGPGTPPAGADPWQTYQALIAWDVQDVDAAKYTISYGTTTGYYLAEVGDDTFSTDTNRSRTIVGLWGGTTFCFKITMTDSKKSWKVHEGTFTTPLTTGPTGEDTDSDGLNDDWEMAYFGDLTTADATSDSEDTDGDGVFDVWELEEFGDLTTTDGTAYPDAPAPDSLRDLAEYQCRTDPTKRDTDGDGLDDATEVAAGSNPLEPPPEPLGFKEGCGAAPGGAPLALVFAALGALGALGALRRRKAE